ncbi:MAG: golgi uridine diphosphate-N- acetylglucosamine transporter [Bogoriella megaspora]|nr:MAG: golgi uridine diphosphate-N- acetylglucosamine transporter [Bogoriella megaspora]
MLQNLGVVSVIVLIFGGCCSNVFALEAIIKVEPDSGLLITFMQFVFASIVAYPFQNQNRIAAAASEKPAVPLYKWAVVSLMFYSVNMLNNWAFAFNISVPVHIILRSFGSVVTMAAGWIRGKRYSRIQVLSVVILTLGVIQSAWADAQSKGKSMSVSSGTSANTQFGLGVLVLFIAQVLSAFMGNYVQDVYAYHSAHWTENLFYSHCLGLPLFVPLTFTLQHQYARLLATPPLSEMKSTSSFASPTSSSSLLFGAMPGGLVMLFINTTMMLACISGVNLLAAKSSAVTVTIVLNIRKLVSFMLSIWLFGNPLSAKMLFGAMLVFGSGALYGWETTVGIKRREELKRKREAEDAQEPKIT